LEEEGGDLETRGEVDGMEEEEGLGIDGFRWLLAMDFKGVKVRDNYIGERGA
jgi:hypothetical protein